ncbi:hypothetical protein GOODEAATRI_019220 [Goodea atripinnis]|uniref:Uncharacterized protein n=1 Tax=Goodea atripinnis TaxID=208336 RepID=A0ABV0NXN6_9TELE
MNDELTIKKKKKKKLKEKVREERKLSDNESAEELASKKISTEDRKVGEESTVVVWDSQVRDGYRRSKAPTADGGASVNPSNHVASAAWDGKRSSDVVEELLMNSTDKAYGANGKTSLLESHVGTYDFRRSNRFLCFSRSPQLGGGSLCCQ